MTALLGLLAIAGYQNRDKLFKMLGDLGKPGAAGPDGIGGLLGQLRKTIGETNPGRVLNDGLGELVDRFKQSGYGDTAESWVGTGPNKSMTPAQLEQAIGPEVLDTLAKQTGLSKDDLLGRLSRSLPNAVDSYTPEGRLPAQLVRVVLTSANGCSQRANDTLMPSAHTCPLWVKSGHLQCKTACPLYPQKRT